MVANLFNDNIVPLKQSFEPFLLGIDDIDSFLELQNKVLDFLKENQKHFLKERKIWDLIAHIGARMPIIGVREVATGQLVAQALLAYPFNEDAVKNLDGYPIEGSTATTAIVQSLCADPTIKGQRLSDIVLDYAKMLANMTGHTQLLAKVAVDNKASTKSFLNASFTKASSGTDPVKKYAVNYLRFGIYDAPAASESVAPAAKIA